MKLKLIQTAGFAGKIKTAVEDLDKHEPVVQQQVTAMFKQPVLPAAKSLVRDKEQLLLELNGEVLPVHQLDLHPEIEKLIKHMSEQLSFEK